MWKCSGNVWWNFSGEISAFWERNFLEGFFTWGMFREMSEGIVRVNRAYPYAIQDYKSLRVTVTIWANLVNTHTDIIYRHADSSCTISSTS